jgi:Right handed beta helix region
VSSICKLVLVVLAFSVSVCAQGISLTPDCSGDAADDTAAITTIKSKLGSNPGTIKLPRKSDPTARCKVNNLTLPPNITVDYMQGGLEVVSGQTFIQRGPIVAPANHAVFYNALAGQGTVSFMGNNSLGPINPVWWGPNTGAAVNAAVGALPTSGGVVKVSPGTYIIEMIATLSKSNTTYDFSGATFCPTSGVSGAYIFYANNVNNVKIIGGTFKNTGCGVPTTVEVNGTYIKTVPIHVNHSTDVEVYGQEIEGFYGGINIYNSSRVVVHHTSHKNSDAGIAVVLDQTAVADLCNVKVHHNTIRGSGDDGIVIIIQGASANAFNVLDSEISDNYIDNVYRGATSGPTGIRVSNVTFPVTTGTLKGITVSGNNMSSLTGFGIYANYVHSSVISNNTVNGFGSKGGNGIQVGRSDTGADRSSDMKIVNNVVVGPAVGSVGCQFDGLMGSRIEGNTCSGNIDGFGGLRLVHTSTGNLVRGNKVRNSHVAGYDIEESVGSNSNTFTQNDVSVNSVAPAIRTGRPLR